MKSDNLCHYIGLWKSLTLNAIIVILNLQMQLCFLFSMAYDYFVTLFLLYHHMYWVDIF